MARLNHISLLLGLGAFTLSGCIKKTHKEQEPATPAQETTTFDRAEPGALELRQVQTKLSIPDPLAGFSPLGSWRPMSRDGAPTPCPFLTKVFWSGSYMVVFGQLKKSTTPPACLGLVSLWDPLTDTWKSLPDAGAATLRDVAIERAEVFLISGQLYVILQKPGESTVLDLAAQTWKKAPDWIALALWASGGIKDPTAPVDTSGASLRGALLQADEAFVVSGARPHVALPAGLSVWFDDGIKVFDWQSGAAKDLPPIPWVSGNSATSSPEWRNYALKSQSLDQSLLVYNDSPGKSATLTPGAFAVSSLLSNPFAWRMVSPPLLVDDQGKPKCADTIGAYATLVESRLVLVSNDSVQNEPQPMRTCISTIDTLTGAMTHTTHQTLSQIAAHSDGSYEYLDLSINDQALSGRRMVFRLKRDGGLVSISDDSSNGFAFQGHDERLLVYDSQNGAIHVTPSLTNSGTLEKVYLLGTDRGIIAWGGHRPKPDGTDEGVTEGMVLDWPL